MSALVSFSLSLSLSLSHTHTHTLSDISGSIISGCWEGVCVAKYCTCTCYLTHTDCLCDLIICVAATHTHTHTKLTDTHCTHITPVLKIQHCLHSDVVNTVAIIIEGMQPWVSLECAYIPVSECVCVCRQWCNCNLACVLIFFCYNFQVFILNTSRILPLLGELIVHILRN